MYPNISNYYCGTDGGAACVNPSERFRLAPGHMADLRGIYNTSTSSEQASQVTIVTTTTATAPPDSKSQPSSIAVGAGVGVPLGLALIGALFLLCRTRTRLEELKNQLTNRDIGQGISPGPLTDKSQSNLNVYNDHRTGGYTSHEVPA